MRFRIMLASLLLLIPGLAARATDAGQVGTVVVSSDDQVPTVRYAGASRYDTAALMAEDRFGDASTVLLARGDLFPDSLAGGFLAGVEDSPLLLTTPDSLVDDAQAALDTLRPDTVVLLGGEAAISADVQRTLEEQGFAVDRVAGANRYETAVDIATRPGATVGTLEGQRVAVVASGEDFPDALVASALSYARGWPLLLTARSSLPPITANTLDHLDIQRVLVPGGTAAVAASVTDAITRQGISVTRLAGATRVETALAVAEFAIEEAGFDRRRVNLATGADFPDGLSMGALAGVDDSAVLLAANADTLGSPAASDYLTAIRSESCAHSLRVAGGPAAVSDGLMSEVRQLITEAGPCVGVLTGPGDARQVGTDVTVTFTLTDQTGDPTVGANVDFEVYRTSGAGETTGPVTTGAATTDADGRAPFTYPGPDSSATDTVVACVDREGDGCATVTNRVVLDDDPTATSTPVEWTGQTCSDDPHENDDTPTTARPANSGEAVTLIACPGDHDWTSIDAGQHAVVAVAVDGARASELTLDIHHPDGTLAASGTETVEAVVDDPDHAGTHTIGVAGAEGDPIDYTITVTTAANCPADDDHEHNDTEGAAAAITSGEPVNAVACPRDDDWFTLEGVAAGDTAMIELELGAGEGVGALRTSDFSYFFGEEPRNVYWVNVQHADVDVGIDLDFESEAGRVYVLTVTDVGEVDCASEADPESNDAHPAAQALTPGDAIDGTLCERDRHDWFTLDATPGDTVDVTLSLDDVGGYLLDLVDPTGQFSYARDSGTSHIGEEDTNTARVSWQVQDDQAGSWAVHAWGAIDSYTLAPEVGPADCDGDDGHEPNDAQSEAEAVASGETTHGEICALDRVDWFAVDANVDDTVEITYATSIPVTVSLVAPDGTPLAGEGGESDGSFSHTIGSGEAGSLGVEVLGAPEEDTVPGDREQDYNLTVTVTG